MMNIVIILLTGVVIGTAIVSGDWPLVIECILVVVLCAEIIAKDAKIARLEGK